MKPPQHTVYAQAVADRLSDCGMRPEILARIGAFTVAWGLFETTLEKAVWALTNEEVKGVRPLTDKTKVSDWITTLGKGSPTLTENANETLHVAAKGGHDLMHYRHSLMHGVLVPFKGSSYFILNPRWHGEIRKRKSGDAHIDRNLLDMAIDSAWALYGIAFYTQKVMTSNEHMCGLEKLLQEARRIRSYANELRNLSVMGDHEKY
jgi:hypothetical protein